jgi:uncharacterized protein YraI
LSASGYIKIAMLMSIVCIIVVFWLVLRLLQLPSERQNAVSLETVRNSANVSVNATTATASPAATATATPSTGISATAIQFPNVHTSPGTTSPIVGNLHSGDEVPVLGRTADSAWLQIRYASAPNGSGWVSTSLMTVSTPTASVPVIQSP